VAEVTQVAPPSVLIWTEAGTTPLVASVAFRVTVTGPLYQPAPHVDPLHKMVAEGATRSTRTVPEEELLLPATSKARAIADVVPSGSEAEADQVAPPSVDTWAEPGVMPLVASEAPAVMVTGTVYQPAPQAAPLHSRETLGGVLSIRTTVEYDAVLPPLSCAVQESVCDPSPLATWDP
jgi:hypothetical protein